MATLAEVLGNEYFKLATWKFIICMCEDNESMDCVPGHFVELSNFYEWYEMDGEDDVYEVFEQDENLKELVPWLSREVVEVASAIDWSATVKARDMNYVSNYLDNASILKIVLDSDFEPGDEKILENPDLVCMKDCYMYPTWKNWPFMKNGDDLFWAYSLNHAKYEKLKDIFINVPRYGQHSICRHALCLILKDGREKIANMSDEDATELVNYFVEQEKRPENSTPFFATTGEEQFRSFVTDTIDTARKIVDVLNTRDILEFLLINPIISSSNCY